MGETQSWLDSWAHTEGWEPCVPHAGREQAGGGVWAETTPGSSFLSWPEGAEGGRGGPRGKGRVGGRTENSGRGLPERGWCAGPELPALHTGRSAMAGGRARRSAALRGSRDPHPGGVSPGRPHLSHRSSPRWDPATGACGAGRGGGLQWVWGQPGEVEEAKGEKKQLAGRS